MSMHNRECKTSLIGRCALVTGAQQGIGAAIALELAKAGAQVIAAWHDNQQSAQQLADQVEQSGVECHLVQADLSDRDSLDKLFDTCEVIGTIDILVNNAAIFPRADFLELPDTLWDEVHTVNLKAPFILSRHVARKLIAANMSGSIINIVSGAAFRGTPRGSHYVASKAGLVGLTRAIAQELAAHNIRVNAVAPGLTDTAQPRYGMTEQDLADAACTIPLGKIAAADDVAPTVRFLASDESRYITGQTLHVNGGSYLT